MKLLLLSPFNHVQLCATPEMVAHQAPQSLGFSRQEHWSGLPFPSPMHESEKWKWSCSVLSDSSRPHGLQPTRLLRPWEFPGKSARVGCHRLLRIKCEKAGFPGDSVVKNPPTNAGKWKVKVKSLSRVRLLVTPWTAAYQAPPSMGFSREEYWSEVPLPSPRTNPREYEIVRTPTKENIWIQDPVSPNYQ